LTVRFIPVLLVALPLAAQNAPVAGPVTFNHDVAPIIYHNCSGCHRPGQAAPFSLLSYDDVVKKGNTIGKVTRARVMPPWKPEPASFSYRDDRRLSDADIAVIQSWVKAGMPEGKPADKPVAPTFASGWKLGEPDLIIEMPGPYHVPADGPDIYRNIAVPVSLTEDKWVAAVDIHPSAPTVVHHALYFADPAGRAHLKTQGTEPGFNGLRAGGASVPLGGWAAGGQPHLYPYGLALRLPKGSDLIVQYHFHPTGKPEEEKSLIGLYFAKKAPDRTLTRVQMPPDYSLFSRLDIQPGEKDFVIRDSYVLPADLDAVGVSAHAHYLCTQVKMTATLPDGEIKTLLYIKDWDFAWQDRYFFEEMHLLPQGTRLDAEIHWDNSAANPRNPVNPPVRVTWGEETKDEMGSVSLIAVPRQEGDILGLTLDLAKRKRQMAAEAMRADPALRKKVADLLAE